MTLSTPARRLLAALGLGAVVLALTAGPGAAGGLRDEILENKYRWGDYAIYLGWHDPAGEQFDVHGSSAWPFGGKIRLRWVSFLRVELDISYYRRSGEATPFDIVNLPKFDGLMVAATIQGTAGNWGPVRPYYGGGPVFVSLTNTFAAIIREVEDEDPDLIDKFAIASWNELDLGVSVVAGLDVPLSTRAFPFLEYRQLFGEVATSDIRIGGFRYGPEELKYADGRDLPGQYDWSGPIVMAGLKVRF